MYELKLKFFDVVMIVVRREEATYRQYAQNPPEHPPSKLGLFGLGAAPSLAKPVGGVLSATDAPYENALVAKPAPSPWVHDELIASTKEHLSIIEQMARMLEMSGSVDRVKVFRDALAVMLPTYESCHQQWKALREHMDKELNERLVLYVGNSDGAHLVLMNEDWGPCFGAFQSVKAEVERALKCFAYQQYTASVFHMMRVAEQGLRAVAKEQRIKLPKDRPIDEAEWGTLTTKLKAAVERVHNWPARKKSKKDALGYYTGVHADVVFFKDRYRNIVSHSLTTFDEPEADRVVTRVCDFMKTVSSRTDETGKRIAWP